MHARTLMAVLRQFADRGEINLIPEQGVWHVARNPRYEEGVVGEIAEGETTIEEQGIGLEATLEGEEVVLPTRRNLVNRLPGFARGDLGARILEEQQSDVLTTVHGVNPVTGAESDSALYSSVTLANLGSIFQTPLGEGNRGTKAVVYQAYDGSYHVAFLSEDVNTHHRHAAAALVRLIEGAAGDGSALDRKAEALYDGRTDEAAELLTQLTGYELLFDPVQGKIVRIKQDSWLTKEQQRTGRLLPPQIEGDMVVALLEHIEPELLSDELRELREPALNDLLTVRAGG